MPGIIGRGSGYTVTLLAAQPSELRRQRNGCGQARMGGRSHHNRLIVISCSCLRLCVTIDRNNQSQRAGLQLQLHMIPGLNTSLQLHMIPGLSIPKHRILALTTPGPGVQVTLASRAQLMICGVLRPRPLGSCPHLTDV